jgi:hypothetical protein
MLASKYLLLKVATNKITRVAQREPCSDNIPTRKKYNGRSNNLTQNNP